VPQTEVAKIIRDMRNEAELAKKATSESEIEKLKKEKMEKQANWNKQVYNTYADMLKKDENKRRRINNQMI
jgi:hypothetical protein